jgi:hypothetical protein
MARSLLKTGVSLSMALLLATRGPKSSSRNGELSEPRDIMTGDTSSRGTVLSLGDGSLDRAEAVARLVLSGKPPLDYADAVEDLTAGFIKLLAKNKKLSEENEALKRRLVSM